MRTFIDYLCLGLAALLLITSAFFAVNSIATAGAEAHTGTRTVANPCYISSAPGTPSQHHAVLFGTMYVDCKRSLQPHHDRVATVTYIQKWNTRYKKYMTYRPYATNETWTSRGNYSTPHASAAIRCDGHAQYRVLTGVYTYRSGQFHHTPPSAMKWRASYKVWRCQNTPNISLREANNP